MFSEIIVIVFNKNGGTNKISVSLTDMIGGLLNGFLAIILPGSTSLKEIKQQINQQVIEFSGKLNYFEDCPPFLDFWDIPFSTNARQSCMISNAGGHSQLSEMLSIHYFETLYSADRFLFEMEVEYWIDYKMIDFSCQIQGERYGISVTRAMGFPNADAFTDHQAENLLNKKLYGLIVARNAVIKEQRFFRSILHVWCQSEGIAQKIRQAYQNLNQDEWEINGSLILLCSVYSDEEIYSGDKYSPEQIKERVLNLMN